MNLKYRPEIDGLRAFAVLPVMLFHAGFGLFGGGFVGVDVFFVISGYLITSIIVKDVEAGSFSFWNFYERRARRILPALFLVVACCIPFAWLWMYPMEFKAFGASVISVCLFASNILFWQQSGYFDTAAELKPLLHTWSLAVEEQFYIVFPIAILLAWRLGRRRVIWAIAAVAILSLGLSEYLSRHLPSANFFLLPTRAWELLAGALCAFAAFKADVRRDNVLSLAGLAALAVSVFAFSEATPFPSLYALLPVLGTCAIILFARPGTLVGGLLALKPIVGIGLISYSAYLWHQPLFAFARIRLVGHPSPTVMMLLLLLSLVFAYLTWRFVEVPTRKRGAWPLPSRAAVFAVLGSIGIVFLALGVGARLKHESLRRLWLANNPSIAHMYELVEASKKRRTWGVVGRDDMHLGDCRFNVTSLNSKAIDTIGKCSAEHGPGVLVLGDSHSINLFGMVAARFDTPFLVGVTRGGCRPHTLKDDCQYEGVKAFIKDNKTAFRIVIFEQAGFYLLKDASGRHGSRAMFQDLPITEAVYGITLDHEYIDMTYNYLKSLTQYTEVVWFGPRIEPHVSDRELVERDCKDKFDLRGNQSAIFAELDDFLKAKVESDRALTYVSQNTLFNFTWPEDIRDCDAVYFSDGDHFSVAGEKRFGMRLPDDFLASRGRIKAALPSTNAP